MKIIKDGKVVTFVCTACGCEYVAGINSVRCNDGNYYAACPICGARCHANITDVIMPGTKREEPLTYGD